MDHTPSRLYKDLHTRIGSGSFLSSRTVHAAGRFMAGRDAPAEASRFRFGVAVDVFGRGFGAGFGPFPLVLGPAGSFSTFGTSSVG